MLPMPNLEKAYYSDKESEAVLQCLQYEQCAGPQKLKVINGVTLLCHHLAKK